jgi:Tol biopolymer transport system component
MLAFDAFEKSAGKQAMSRQIIVVRDIATGKEAILRGRQDGAGSPVWSPDGKQIAFLSLVAKAEVMTGGCGGEHYASHLWVMATDGSNAHQLAKGSYYGAPAWARSLEPEPVD